MAELTGSEILGKALKREGTENLFFIVGGPMLLAEEWCIKVKSSAAFPDGSSHSEWCYKNGSATLDDVRWRPNYPGEPSDGETVQAFG